MMHSVMKNCFCLSKLRGGRKQKIYEDVDQMLLSAVSDLGMHCFSTSYLTDQRQLVIFYDSWDKMSKSN